jgi:hypothetical protein
VAGAIIVVRTCTCTCLISTAVELALRVLKILEPPPNDAELEMNVAARGVPHDAEGLYGDHNVGLKNRHCGSRAGLPN